MEGHDDVSFLIFLIFIFFFHHIMMGLGEVSLGEVSLGELEISGSVTLASRMQNRGNG